ncbi:MAG: CCA tRNA nucleotidyltransferase [Chloroflexi bacterium]|nr:CCA tRNA nucleotidyltransferase [Chloroflexota bacterium]
MTSTSYAKGAELPLLAKLKLWLSDRGLSAYVVGGYVRDLVVGRYTHDIDIAVGADCAEVAAEVARSLGGKHVVLDQAERVARVVVFEAGQPRWHLDFSTLRGSIENDLAQRDFTIDAMALDTRHWENATISADQLIDPLSGRVDLEQGLVRATSEVIFQHDPGRLLRAVRLAAELGFTIEPATALLIKQHSHLLEQVAPERLQDELCRILAASPVRRSLGCLDEMGLLDRLFPGLAATRGVTQPKEHFWDVFTHLLETVAAIERLAESLDAELGRWAGMLRQHLGQEVASGHTRLVLLKLAGLLHDIAKPQTKTVDDTGRTRFFSHSQQGAEAVSNIMARLRFSARERQLLGKMVEHHLRPTQMSYEDLPTRRAIYRYFRDVGDAAIDTLLLSLADHLAARGPNLDPAQWRWHVNVVDYALEQHLATQQAAAPARLVDGHDLMSVLGLRPGPELGRLLEVVREAQAAGEVATREQALDVVRKLIAGLNSGEGEQR